MERTELDLALPDDLQLLQQAVRDFAEAEIAPRHEEIDHAATHPAALVDAMRDLGLFGVLAPSEHGGAGLGLLAQVVVVEELARVGGFAAAMVAAHGAALGALATGAGDAAAVQALSAGALGAPAFDETDSGHVGCRAVADGAGLRLTGRKTLVPFPGRAASFVVLAVDAQQAPVLACVAPDAAGVRHVRAESGMGLLGLEGAALELDGAPAARLGGAELVARTLDDLRIAVAALLAGVARGAIDHALRYGQERRQFDRPLLEFGAVQERLASADARTFAVRASVHAAARLRDRGEPYGLAAARARRVAGETAVCAADDALQVFGGYGYSREYPAERFYRDARFTGFGEARPAALDAAVVRGLVG